MMNDEDRVRLFAVAHGMALQELRTVESNLAHDIVDDDAINDARDQVYYPQFGLDLRGEAADMGRHYAVFYCLERTIRKLITETIEAADGPRWWAASRVPQAILDNVAKSMTRERESIITPRSENAIDYTSFGELSEIIKHNWDLFGALFNNKSAVEKVMSNLNLLRNNIAHCCPIKEDEVVRLRLSVKDWFRLME